MKKVYNIFIPAKGFRCLTVWPFIFVRLEEKRNYGEVDEMHEGIHGEQQKEMLLLAFFLWYAVEWLVRWAAYGFDGNEAYRNISFEQEAFMNERDFCYMKRRRPFAWLKYLTQKSYRR